MKPEHDPHGCSCPNCRGVMVRQELIDGSYEIVCLTCKNAPPKKPRKKKECKHTKVAKASMGAAELLTPQGYCWWVDAICLSCGAWNLESDFDERWAGWHHPRELAGLQKKARASGGR